MINPLFAITISSITSALFAYLAFRLFFKQQIQTNNTGVIILENKLLFAVLYGFFTIYAGFIVTPNGATVRLLGPLFVGMMAGWRYGVLTSLFGVALLGMKEWLNYIPDTQLIGNTFYSSMLATVLAGYLPGLWHYRLKGKLPKIWQAVAFSVAFELLVHLPVTLLVAWPFEVVWRSVKIAFPELILAHAIGMGVMVFVIGNLIAEKLALLERQRIDGELASARVIQQGLCKKKTPVPFSIPGIDLYACVVNEDQASNSFLDYYYSESRRKLYFIIVEIAEITTTATLTMLVIKTLFRTKAQKAATLQSIMNDIDHELVVVSDIWKSRSAFLGIIDVDTGLISDRIAVNYGALVRNKEGAWHDLPGVGTAESVLQAGEILVLANSFSIKPGAGENDRALFSLFDNTATMQQSGEKMVAFLKNDGRNDCDAGAVLMLMKYQKPAEKMTLGIDLKEIGRLHDWLAEFAQKQALSDKLLSTLKLVLEELVVNSIQYGFGQDAGEDEQIEVQIQRVDERIVIVIKDRGQAFDLLKDNADKPKQKRQVGGWGIQLVRKSVDKMEYERKDGFNILSIEININGR
ncbi:MAG: ATP-binding protein [Negativicutes bacterium]|nr:ATP-binding protein [Negativicutes bacterium]